MRQDQVQGKAKSYRWENAVWLPPRLSCGKPASVAALRALGGTVPTERVAARRPGGGHEGALHPAGVN